MEKLILSGKMVDTGQWRDNGFESREAYLESLCEDYPREAVMALADLLGPSEDFDGLVTALKDEFD